MHFFHNNEKEFITDFYKNNNWHEEDKIIVTHKNRDVNGFNRHIRTKFWEQKGVNTPQALLPGYQLRFNSTYSINDITLYHNGQIVEIESAELQYHDTLQIHFWLYKSQGPAFRVVDSMSINAFNAKLSSIAKLVKPAKYPEEKSCGKHFIN